MALVFGGARFAAALYGLYHVGYGMASTRSGSCSGWGVVYGVAFATARNLLVLWPLLVPLGSFVANLEAGIVPLRWASILSFGTCRHRNTDTHVIKPGRGNPR